VSVGGRYVSQSQVLHGSVARRPILNSETTELREGTLSAAHLTSIARTTLLVITFMHRE